MRNNRGFTLIELVVTLGVSGILFSVGMPSLQDFVLNNRLATQANGLISSLHLARSEAIKRYVRVVVCKTPDGGSTCSNSGDWRNGWIVFLDENGNAVKDADEEILRTHEALTGTDQSLYGSSDIVNYVSFGATGVPMLVSGASQQGNFVLCDSRGLDDESLAIVLSANGQVTTIKAQDDASITGCS